MSVPTPFDSRRLRSYLEKRLGSSIGIGTIRPSIADDFIAALSGDLPLALPLHPTIPDLDAVERITDSGVPLIEEFRKGTRTIPRSTRPHLPYDVHVRETALIGLTNTLPILDKRTEHLIALSYVVDLIHDGGEDDRRFTSVRPRVERYVSMASEALASYRGKIEDGLGVELPDLLRESVLKLTSGRRRHGDRQDYASVIGQMTRGGSTPGKILALGTKFADRQAQKLEQFLFHPAMEDLLASLDPRNDGPNPFLEIVEKANLSFDGKQKKSVVTEKELNKLVTRFARDYANATSRARTDLLRKTIEDDRYGLVQNDSLKIKTRNREPWEWNVDTYKGRVLAFKTGHFFDNQLVPAVREGGVETDVMALANALLLRYAGFLACSIAQSERNSILFPSILEHKRSKPFSLFRTFHLLEQLADQYMNTPSAYGFQRVTGPKAQGIKVFNKTLSLLHSVESNDNGHRVRYRQDIHEQFAHAIILPRYDRLEQVRLREFSNVWSGVVAGTREPEDLPPVYIMKGDFPTMVR